MSSKSSIQRIIFHIDFDSFFASVEQQYNPAYRNKPIGITATNGRTCVIAASREAKKDGVATGCRTFDAVRLCPTIRFVPAHFSRYWEISKKFISICQQYSPHIEVFSLDELFMDVTETVFLYKDVFSLVDKIKKQITEEIGPFITVSIGISYNRILAKLATGLKKPNGVFQITPQNLIGVYSVAKLTDICGIGPRIESRLQMMGIYKLVQLRSVPLSALISEFGDVEGHFLYNVGHGIDESPVMAFERSPDAKSVGRQYCLAKNEYDRRVVLQNVYELCEEVCFKLRRVLMRGRTFGVSLVGTQSIYGHETSSEASDQTRQMYAVCMRVIKRNHDLFEEGYIRRIGVWAGNLQRISTLPYFLLPEDQKYERIIKIKDSVNEKFGRYTIRNGFLLYAKKLETVPNGYGSDQYEMMKMRKFGV